MLTASSTDQLVADLKKALLLPTGTGDQNNANPQMAQYLGALDGALAKARYSDAEQLLNALRTGPAGANAKAVACIDQLILELKALTNAAIAQRDAALDQIMGDASAKFFSNAKVADFDPLLKRLAELPPVSGQYNDPSVQKTEAVRSFVTRAQDYMQQTALGNPDQAANTLNELIQIAGRLPALPRSKLLAMQAEAAAGLAARNDVIAIRLEALKKSALTAIDSAKAAADFDEILVELAKPLAFDSSRSGGNYNSLTNQLESLRRFTRRWQDYFSQIEAGNTTAAQNTLRELAGDNSSEAFYPRSRILARLNPKIPVAPGAAGGNPAPGSAEPLVSPAELTVGTIDKLFQQLQLRRFANMSPAGLDDLPSELGYLRTAVAQLKAGNSQAVVAQLRLGFSTSGRVGGYAEALAALRNDILMRVAPSYLEAPAEVQPSKQDSYEAYCKKVVEYGRVKKDWPLVYRGLFSSLSQPMINPVNNPELTGYRQFFSGLQQESAGLWYMAARSYFSCLNSGALNLPVDEIGGRLKRIKSDHPEEYSQAQSLPFNGDPFFPPGRPMDPRTNYVPLIAPAVPPAATTAPKPPQPASEPQPAK